MTKTAVVSVHDVAPETMSDVLRIVERLDGIGAPPATLLVIPGREWTDRALSRLRALARKGHPLAGHGWSHRAAAPGSVRHRLHALIISRDQAEHLSRPTAELAERVEKCHAWFGERDLEVGDLYVPPAWALGALEPEDLRRLPFRWYETLTGILDGRTGRLKRLPLVGFEADTPPRKAALRMSNAVNLEIARAWERPLRVSLHPSDLDLLLAGDVERLLHEDWNFVSVEDVMVDGGRRGGP